ncbi:MAG TPA: ATP-binding protein [Thermoanaerobaculia bacterium]|nr:ATP-binding protein [Thermoanaerobaculia bacterium]
MIQRNLTATLRDALSDRPVVLLTGARQTGKSTLAQSLLDGHAASYLTLDDATVLAAAAQDPQGFLAGLGGGPVVLDEVQRAPGLFPAIKLAVDRDRTPGRFLLTGSADVFLLPTVSESLAGRMEILTLWPLSQGEVEGVVEGFVDALFSPTFQPPPAGPLERADLFRRLIQGGFPEPRTKSSPARLRAWFSSYTTTILQRDVRDLTSIENLSALPRLLSLLGARAAGLLNYAELSRSSGQPASTLKRYFTLLEATFLVQALPAWSSNLSKRLVKSPKVFPVDSGLLCHLLGIDESRLEADPTLPGPVLETFVLTEIRKQIGWSREAPSLFHYRTQTGQEVDFLLENAAGRIAGVEVKGSASVQERDVRALRDLAAALGPRFSRGVILYLGERVVPFGEKILAVPLPSLWRSSREG